MPVEDNIRTQYPLLIAKRYEAVGLADDPELRVMGLLDLYEDILRYLALVGLAEHDLLGLKQKTVQETRAGLRQPSMGHWLKLFKAVYEAMHEVDSAFQVSPLNQVYREDAIEEAGQRLAIAIGIQPSKKVRLVHLLDYCVTFRNKKIGHGDMRPGEAREIQGPLEAALLQWLDGLDMLRDCRLIYIERVEWQDPHFLYIGRDLNIGTSIAQLNLKAKEGVTPRRVYLHPGPDKDRSLIPLYPFFDFDGDANLLYVYYELSNKNHPRLRCFSALSSEKNTLELDAEAELVLSGPGPANEKRVEKPEPKQPQPVTSSEEKETYPVMKSWYDLIPPHEDIKKGDFDEAVFAADVSDVASGDAPEDYRDPYLFYTKTYLTAGLKNLLARVHNTLANGKGSSVVQIQTPFGGGKTHALVSIYHYLKNGSKIKELLPLGLELITPNLSVISGNHWDPVAGMSGEGITRRTFWGELAYQVGGQEGYELVRENDEARISPGKAKLRELLEPRQPFILLFDEILEYINRALDVRDYQTQERTGVSLGTQTFSFFQELTETVATIPHGMLVVTLPSSYLEDFGEQQEESLARLGKIFGRIESIETPVQGEEVYAVIRRRLFDVEHLKKSDMRAVVHRYYQQYQQYRDDLPPKARDVSYRDRMEMAYPFHPDVIDILYEKWSTYPTFQRTRGVLRLLANVIEDLYQREVSLDMIHPGDLNMDKAGIRQEFLKHIGLEYEGVIGSDIAGHEAKAPSLDKANRPWNHLAQRISTAIFFHSFSADESEKGINLPYIKLSVMHAETMPAMITEVLNKLTGALWYLNTKADSYYFSRIPNLNRMILDKKELFNEAYEPELQRIISKEAGRQFRVYLWPESSQDIPDNRELKLVILHPQDSGNRIPEWIERRGNNFREYKNTLFFALADPGAFAKLREDVKTTMALEEIEKEIKGNPDSPLAAKRDEVERRQREISRDFSYNVRRMYHLIRFGEREVDLGTPVAGQESLDHWYWSTLTSSETGGIVNTMSSKFVVNKFMAENDQLATASLLEQFYKNPGLPVPSEQGVVARAIQLGVKEGAFGLVEAHNGEVDWDTLKFKDEITYDRVSFELGEIIISREVCEAHIVESPPSPEGGNGGGTTTGPIPTGGGGTITGNPPTPPPPPPGEKVYRRLRLVVSEVPASRIGDVNRGILMPFSRAVGDFKFTIEIEVESEDGVSQSTLENQVKETIRQIGARIVEEEAEE
jgi:hypothetical protein